MLGQAFACTPPCLRLSEKRSGRPRCRVFMCNSRGEPANTSICERLKDAPSLFGDSASDCSLVGLMYRQFVLLPIAIDLPKPAIFTTNREYRELESYRTHNVLRASHVAHGPFEVQSM